MWVFQAKNTAVQRLNYFDLRDGRTLWHNFHHQVGRTHVFAAPKPPGKLYSLSFASSAMKETIESSCHLRYCQHYLEGYGLVCHRAIKEIARCIGIEDMYCKVEGPTKNIQNVTEAFIRGLLAQVCNYGHPIEY